MSVAREALADSKTENWRMRVGFGLGLMTLILTLLFGCDIQGRASSFGVVRDSAGVRLVDLPGSAFDGTVTELSIDPSWAPSAGLEIGDLLDLAVIPGRGILLLDELAESVSFVSNSGEVLAVIGRAGQGPGEFNPQGLSQIITTDSSVFVPDLFSQRLTEFNFGGEVLGMQGLPQSPVYAVDWRSYPGGGLAFRAVEQLGDQIIRFEGEATDTVLSLQFSNDYTNLLLAPATLWDLTETGNVLFARTDRACVELLRKGTGDVLWRAQWAQPAGELGEESVAHLEGLVRDRILRDTPDISGELLTGNLAMIQYPEKAPVLAGLMSGPGGDVWVRRAKPVGAMGPEALLLGSSDGIGGQDWAVLTSEGLFKARARLPAGFTPRRFSAGWIYGILADDLGIETAARVWIGS